VTLSTATCTGATCWFAGTATSPLPVGSGLSLSSSLLLRVSVSVSQGASLRASEFPIYSQSVSWCVAVWSAQLNSGCLSNSACLLTTTVCLSAQNVPMSQTDTPLFNQASICLTHLQSCNDAKTHTHTHMTVMDFALHEDEHCNHAGVMP